MNLTQDEAERRAADSGRVAASRTNSIAIVGLGYVGLPLAVAFDGANHRVVGYDVDADKVAALADGSDPTGEVGDGAVAESDVTFAADPAAVADAEYVVVTVPTPVDETQNPDLRFVEAAGEAVGNHLRPGTTVVLESTVFPGATRNVLVPAVESASDLSAGEEFHVAYSPERVAPGDENHGLAGAVKVVGADEEAVRADVAALYETVVDAGVHEVASLEAAEATKCVENVQRDLNIAFVNELSIVFDRMGIDTREVLEAARTKWNFHDYSPGLVGGHCIPVDPFYFAYGSEMEGYTPKLTLKGREVNEYMPKHVAELTLRALNECGNVLGEGRVLVLGLTYKPNVADIRTSEVSGVIAELRRYGVEVVGYDPLAAVERTRESFGIEIQEVLSFEGFDGVVIPTPHDAFEEIDLAEASARLADDPFVVDVDGFLEESAAVEAGFHYRTL